MKLPAATGFTDYFGNFLVDYPTPDDRLAAAARLMVGNVDQSLSKFPSRIQLVARWAEDNEALHQKAVQLYETRHIARRYAGQLALSFASGSREDINLEDGWLDNQLVLRIGRVSDGDMVHQAARRRSQNPDARRLLAHHMGLAASGPVLEIEADVVGEPTAKIVQDDAILPIWDGMSPITKDRQVYTDVATDKQHELVLGTTPVMSTLEELASVTGRSGLLDYARQFAAAN